MTSITTDVTATLTLTEGTYCRYNQYNGTGTLGADVTFNGGFRISWNERASDAYNPTFQLNGYTATALETVILYPYTTMNIGSGTLHYNSAGGSDIASDSTVTLQAGPGATIKGYSAATKTTFESQNNWKVVGKCENLDVTNEELRVTGQVINCTGDIIQQHPSIDADQQLDYDTADDRDIQFGVPDLDHGTELVT